MKLLLPTITCCFLLLLGGGYWKLLQRINQPSALSQGNADSMKLPAGNYLNYFSDNLDGPGQPFVWVELGKKSKPQTWLRGKGLVSIRLAHFAIGRHWAVTDREQQNGEVAWHMKTEQRGRITMQFRNQKLLPLIKDKLVIAHLYLVDDGDKQRNVRIVANKDQYIISEFFPGRWVAINLSEEDVVNSTAVIELSPLTGSGGLVSALALTVTNKNGKA